MTIPVVNKSVVTSGIYERHLTVDGQDYHHIFDSQTGYPVETELASLTIISDKSVDGEIWTTRLFGERPASILWQVESLEGIEVILIDKEGHLSCSSEFLLYRDNCFNGILKLYYVKEKGNLMLKLIAIVGTNSKRSTNRQLLQYMQKHFADKAEIELVEIKAIPVFNKPADKQVPAEILEIAAKIEEADGVIIGTPEYDHSIPAVLMSALAWLSYGIYPLLNKPIMITGASYGTLGSSRAQLQLRQILNAPEIKANVLPDEFLLSHSLQAFNPSGDLVDLDVIKKLDAIFDDFRIFVKITEKLRNAQELLRKDAEDFDWENL